MLMLISKDHLKCYNSLRKYFSLASYYYVRLSCPSSVILLISQRMLYSYRTLIAFRHSDCSCNNCRLEMIYNLFSLLLFIHIRKGILTFRMTSEVLPTFVNYRQCCKEISINYYSSSNRKKGFIKVKVKIKLETKL